MHEGGSYQKSGDKAGSTGFLEMLGIYGCSYWIFRKCMQHYIRWLPKTLSPCEIGSAKRAAAWEHTRPRNWPSTGALMKNLGTGTGGDPNQSVANITLHRHCDRLRMIFKNLCRHALRECR